jgi:serine/threonine protein kinase/Tol biopolymer transport system component
MTPELWRKVKDLFHEALEQPAAERDAFLAAACVKDQELRARVERMLVADARDSVAVDKGASSVARLLIPDESESFSGRLFAHYRLEREIGAGGMGRVYLARDTRLNRPVALKLLPQAFSENPERVRRFQQEARAVSALNHPNIITIHEIGETDGLRYIVTELVEGETLAEYIARGQHDLTRVIKIIIQVAEALTAAHGAGIVHRDIKPENIMLRSDGYVKVLDFGIAKLSPKQSLGMEDGVYPASREVTSPGLVLGTVKYMSPEQARGREVDARTDIFSLGIVLYEAIAGQYPFPAGTRIDNLIAVAGFEPRPLVDHAPETPLAVQQIVERALRKDRDERYQTVAELRHDLEQLVHHSQSGPRLIGMGPTTTSSAEYLIGRIKRHKMRAVIAALLCVLLLTASGFAVFRILRPPIKKPRLDIANLRFTKLTADGGSSGTISPDGKYVLYGHNGAMSVKQLATGNIAPILAAKPGFVAYGCSFAADSNYVYCWFQEIANSRHNFFERIPLVPGPTQRIMEGDVGAPAFSADGRRMAYLRVLNEYPAIALADSNGANEHVLAPHRPQSPYYRGLAWSPDGQWLAVATSAEGQDENRSALVLVRVKDGSEVPLGAQRWRMIRNFVWLPDGSGLVISAVDRVGDTEQLWLVPYPSGSPERLTPELSNFSGVSITADGSKMVTNQSDRPANIWVAATNGSSRAVKLNTSAAAYGTVEWTPDGRIVYAIEVGNRGSDLWIMDADGGNNKQLTFEPTTISSLAVSPDGRYIIFASNRGRGFSLWRMNIDGSDLKQLTTGTRDSMPQFTADGKSIIYESSTDASHSVIYKLSLDSGIPVQIGETNLAFTVLAISPNGQHLAYWRRDDASRGTKTVIQSMQDGKIEKELEGFGYYEVQWSTDGTALLYAKDNEIWQSPINGGPPKRMTDFKTDQSIRFSLSQDGKHLAVVQGNWTSDVVLISLR